MYNIVIYYQDTDKKEDIVKFINLLKKEIEIEKIKKKHLNKVDEELNKKIFATPFIVVKKGEKVEKIFVGTPKQFFNFNSFEEVDIFIEEILKDKKFLLDIQNLIKKYFKK